MSHPRNDAIDSALERFGAEVLRWNAGFSLISRNDTETRLQELLDEAVASFDVLRDELSVHSALIPENTPIRTRYLDLGSGGGFPGLVWHLLWSELGVADRDLIGSLLVEPRAKRAWFLEHAAQLLGLEGLDIGADQWGRRTGLVSPDEDERVLGVISLKALHLTDDEILRGWRRYRSARPEGSDTVIVCRFHPHDVPLDDALRNKLSLPGGGACDGDSAGPGVHLVKYMIGARPHALLFSVYPSV